MYSPTVYVVGIMPIKSPSFVVISAVTTVALELCSAATALSIASVEMGIKAS